MCVYARGLTFRASSPSLFNIPLQKFVEHFRPRMATWHITYRQWNFSSLCHYCEWCWRLMPPHFPDGSPLGYLCSQCIMLGFDNGWRPPWDNCYWCWHSTWLDFSMLRLGVVNGGLCYDCLAHGLSNDWVPPWQPDARRRLSWELGQLGWPVDVAAHIAELVHCISEP